MPGFTDWLDGFLARSLNQTTRFGAFLDPVADKVMVSIALILIAEEYHSIWVTIPAATMIAREVIISALREWMAELGKRASVAVSWVGKIKTATQMFALTMLLWQHNDFIVNVGLWVVSRNRINLLVHVSIFTGSKRILMSPESHKESS